MPFEKLRSLPYSATGSRKSIKTENTSIIKLQGFFRKIIAASENAPIVVRKILKRLTSTNRVRQPVKISMIAENKDVISQNKVALVVAKVLDDERMLEIPAMKIVALKWSKSVQQKIEANGGSIHTLDEFINVAKEIDNLVFIQQDPNHRKSAKYWGAAPGLKGSTAYPKAYNKHHSREKRIRLKKPMKLNLEKEE